MGRAVADIADCAIMAMGRIVMMLMWKYIMQGGKEPKQEDVTKGFELR